MFVGLALGLAVVFVRLGFWQLARLKERQARNAQIAARLAEPMRPISVLRDTTSYRRATVAGVPDYANEITFTGRSRNGSPGVFILTPMRFAGSDSAVIVVRGWVYSPDAATADLSRWKESRTAFSGYTATLPSLSVQDHLAGARKIRLLSAHAIRQQLPYAVSSRYLVSQDSGDATAPARLAAPELDYGPHLSYAIQWFAFALTAIVGSGIVAMRARLSPDNGPERS